MHAVRRAPTKSQCLSLLCMGTPWRICYALLPRTLKQMPNWLLDTRFVSVSLVYHLVSADLTLSLSLSLSLLAHGLVQDPLAPLSVYVVHSVKASMWMVLSTSLWKAQNKRTSFSRASRARTYVLSHFPSCMSSTLFSALSRFNRVRAERMEASSKSPPHPLRHPHVILTFTVRQQKVAGSPAVQSRLRVVDLAGIIVLSLSASSLKHCISLCRHRP